MSHFSIPAVPVLKNCLIFSALVSYSCSIWIPGTQGGEMEEKMVLGSRWGDFAEFCPVILLCGQFPPWP